MRMFNSKEVGDCKLIQPWNTTVSIVNVGMHLAGITERALIKYPSSHIFPGSGIDTQTQNCDTRLNPH